MEKKSSSGNVILREEIAVNVVEFAFGMDGGIDFLYYNKTRKLFSKILF